MHALTWLNEPPAWRRDGDRLVATAGPRTDFWQRTKYGIVRDDGHVYGRTVAADASAEVTVRGAYVAQYDQAGLALRLDAERWVKCGVELVDGVPHASVVVTNRHSDWSIIPLPPGFGALSLRLVREGDAIEILWGMGAGAAPTTLARLAPFPAGPALLGAMLAAPEGDGFDASFGRLTIREG